MAQRKKKLTKRKGRPGRREPEADSDSGGDVGLVTDNRGDEEENSCRKLPHFPAATDGCTSDVEPDTRQLVRCQNKKKKKSGGFQSMGLSYPVYKGVMKKGYKVPTPIQRKTVPVILDGKDIVAMARTGSGKTAAFLIPMFEKLKGPNAQTGARALILTPTRELALQTMKFTKELGRFTGLKTALILGGDGMDDQFAALHENPDIIIGTPGRLMHVIQQMNLKLQSVEYVVFDEADRLFEMGFAEQLTEIIRRLPDNRQSLLFSATLPKLLVEFARAGLTEPVLIRLDVDTKLSDQLKLNFFHLRLDDKPALLLHLLRHVVKPQEQTVVFVATKHHVEYVKQLLTLEGVECAYIYSALDQTARKINIGKFVHRKAMVLIVTDVAARGIDIPLLDNVINYNFPSKAKLFLHRVGRVARAGRSGVSYSLVCPDEIPFVYDLHLFLGRPLQLATPQHPPDADGVFGRVPQCILDDEGAQLLAVHENSLDLSQIHHISENAYKQYLKSRPSPSPESIKRVKNTDLSTLAVHPMLGAGMDKMELERLHIVDAIKGYKSKSTIFEINSNSKTVACKVMRRKRSRDTRLVEKYSKKREDQVTESRLLHAHLPVIPSNQTVAETLGVEGSEEEEELLQGVFSEVVGGKRRRPAQENEETEKPTLKRSKAGGKDEEFYIPYRPKDFDSERGLSLGSEGTMFDQQATSAVLDMMGDEGRALNQHKRIMKWDRKKKRFVTDTGKEDQKKRVRLETGQVVSAKNKKNLYPAFSLLATLTSCCTFCLVVDVFTASRGFVVCYVYHKPHNLSLCGNYRGIMLLSVPGKVLNGVILQRLNAAVDAELRDNQAGFRPNRSCADQIATLRIILEQSQEFRSPLYAGFLDFEKAFDSLDREVLWQLMRHYAIPEKFINIIKNIYSGTQCRIIHEGQPTEAFNITTGVRQGCSLSPLLFLLAVDWIMRQATYNRQNGIQWTPFTQLDDLDFADDIALLAHNHQQMKDKLRVVEQRAAETGLRISTQKTKVLKANTKTLASLTVNQQPIEEVDSFIYLGREVASDGGSEGDVKRRIGKARAAFGMMGAIWRARNITLGTKIRLFNSSIKSILLYGSETWKTTKKLLKKLQVFTNHCLRRILNIRWPDKIRNKELWERTHQPAIEVDIMRRRWGWIGHTLRKPRNTITRQALQWNPQGKRGRGRPRNTWRRSVTAEMERAGYRWQDLERLALNRTRWRDIISGLCSNLEQQA